ncbi:MAG: Txe/YoeB family addiction module toxin [Bacteroidetes bacterium]|nr:Txe/YoeB family addiction module toxin [Bacteroidota bacterium]
MEIELTKEALKDLKYWRKIGNVQIQKRISALFDDIKKHPHHGIGNPEALKHELSGFWSRRINKEHRLVYKLEYNKIIVISMRFHY